MSQAGLARISSGSMPPSVPTQFNGNTGSAVPLGNELNIQTANTTVEFVGSGNTILQDFNKINLGFGSSLPAITSGIDNVTIGNSTVGALLTSGSKNVIIGYEAGTSMQTNSLNVAIGYNAMQNSIADDCVAIGFNCLPNASFSVSGMVAIGSGACFALTTGNDNTAVGYKSLNSCTTGNSNTSIGANCHLLLTTGIRNTGLGDQCGNKITSGFGNTCIGYFTGLQITTGNINTCIGHRAGASISLGQSSNILLGSEGTFADNNVIRIGTQGSGGGQQNTAFMAGIVGVTVSNSAFVSIDTTTGQLGTVSSALVAQTITGNTGGPIPPSGGNWNFVTTNSTPIFSGSGSTITLDFNLSNLVLGSSLPSLTSGIQNVGIGSGIFGSLNSGQSNTAIGFVALNAIAGGLRNTAVGAGALQRIVGDVDATAVGYNCLTNMVGVNSNTGVGSNCLVSCTSGGGNTGVGQSSLGAIVTAINCTGMGFESLKACTGQSNTALGYRTAIGLLSGTFNTIIGISSGQNYTGAESSNVLIRNDGVVGETHTIRIGTQGTADGAQTQTHIAGVINTVSGRVVKTTVPGAYPYTTLTTDYVIFVDTSAARTINLVASPVTGTTYRIKDNVGTAAANNITITPAAGNIDGAASLVINTNYASVDVVYNGTQWSVF